MVSYVFLDLSITYFKVITGKEGMGYGDFKLLAALGAWMGPLMLPLIVLLSSLIGAIIGIILLKLRNDNQAFCFGPYIAIAGWVAFLWGGSDYENLFGEVKMAFILGITGGIGSGKSAATQWFELKESKSSMPHYCCSRSS